MAIGRIALVQLGADIEINRAFLRNLFATYSLKFLAVFAGKKQINQRNQKTTVRKSTVDSFSKKTKPELSNSFFQKIISLLKKEELI